MAKVNEDESAGLVSKKFVGVGERWVHLNSGKIAVGERWVYLNSGKFGVTEWLHVVGDVVRKGELYSFYGVDALAKCDIPAMSQCVIYTGRNNSKVYVRTVANFLERFERVA